MKYLLILLAVFVFAACNSRTEQIRIEAIDGKDGTSCSVAPEVDEEYQQIGSRISCTDGSYSVVYNGAQGAQGPQGNQGVQGPVGQNGKSCQTYKSILFDGVWLSCPNQLPVLISNGKDGDSCSSFRENHKDRVRITCGNNVTYVYDGNDGEDGKNGKDGKSCAVTSAPGGANVKCGNDVSVFIANGSPGPQGTQGPQGQPGRDGLNGTDGVDGEDAFIQGLSCNVHNLSNWNGVTNILTVLASNPPVGNFVLSNLSVGNSPSASGFPGMPSLLQNQVGLEGYALDCSGYLNIQTSGMHVFEMLSDDGVRLVIQDQVIISNPGLHAPTTDISTSRELHRGPNKINVIYYQGPHSQIALRLKMSGPNTTSQVIPSTLFRH